LLITILQLPIKMGKDSLKKVILLFCPQVLCSTTTVALLMMV